MLQFGRGCTPDYFHRYNPSRTECEKKMKTRKRENETPHAKMRELPFNYVHFVHRHMNVVATFTISAIDN